MEEKRDIDFSEHHRTLKCVSLEPRLDSRRSLLLVIQLGLLWLKGQLREVDVASIQFHRLLLALEKDVVDLATLLLARFCEMVVELTRDQHWRLVRFGFLLKLA